MSDRKLALITGAARRIGRAVALELGAHGWDIALHYRRSHADAEATAHDLRALGARVQLFGADLADEAACEALVPQVLQRMGTLTALVNNASLFEHDDLAAFRPDAFERHWRLNTAAPILLARALHAHRSALPAGGATADDACVVNLLDQKLFNPNPDHLSYTLSKAALQCATTLLAQALAPALRVCAVAPGLTLGSAAIDDERLAALQAKGPLRRGVDVHDVARAVRFALETPSMTGSTLLVDAGSHLQPRARDFAFEAAGH
jgi:NAD(P)-dependent dehydrogenase (short-subunit alcohol dehydrogenase family)